MRISLDEAPSFAKPRLRFKKFSEKQMWHELTQGLVVSFDARGESPYSFADFSSAKRLQIQGSFASEYGDSPSRANRNIRDEVLGTNLDSEGEVLTGRGEHLRETSPLLEGESPPSDLPLRKLRREFLRYYAGSPMVTGQMMAQARRIYSSSPPIDTPKLLSVYKSRIWPLDAHLEEVSMKEYDCTKSDELSSRKELNFLAKDNRVRRGSLGLEIELIVLKGISSAQDDEADEKKSNQPKESMTSIQSRHSRQTYSMVPNEKLDKKSFGSILAPQSSSTQLISSSFFPKSAKKPQQTDSESSIKVKGGLFLNAPFQIIESELEDSQESLNDSRMDSSFENQNYFDEDNLENDSNDPIMRNSHPFKALLTDSTVFMDEKALQSEFDHLVFVNLLTRRKSSQPMDYVGKSGANVLLEDEVGFIMHFRSQCRETLMDPEAGEAYIRKWKDDKKKKYIGQFFANIFAAKLIRQKMQRDSILKANIPMKSSSRHLRHLRNINLLHRGTLGSSSKMANLLLSSNALKRPSRNEQPKISLKKETQESSELSSFSPQKLAKLSSIKKSEDDSPQERMKLHLKLMKLPFYAEKLLHKIKSKRSEGNTEKEPLINNSELQMAQSVCKIRPILELDALNKSPSLARMASQSFVKSPSEKLNKIGRFEFKRDNQRSKKRSTIEKFVENQFQAKESGNLTLRPIGTPLKSKKEIRSFDLSLEKERKTQDKKERSWVIFKGKKEKEGRKLEKIHKKLTVYKQEETPEKKKITKEDERTLKNLEKVKVVKGKRQEKEPVHWKIKKENKNKNKMA